jgi:ribosomal protein S12 methylthiotransferase accessory factor
VTDLVDIDFNSSSGLALLASLSDRHGQRLARAAKLPGRLFLLRSPWAPGLRLVGGQIDPGHLLTPGLSQPPFSVAGSAEGLEDALAACIAEGVERLSQIERPGDVSVECSLAELDPPVIPAVGRLIKELVVRSQLPRDTRIGWMRGRSLSTGHDLMLPADWCLRRHRAGHLTIPGAAMSTGCAAGPSFATAATRALLELIERDAASLWWIGGQRPRPLAVDDQAMAEGVRLLADLRQGCRRRVSWLLDITTDFAIPCVAAVSVNADGRGLTCGLAARLSLKEAVRAAVLEMCQMELAFPIAANKMKQRGEAALNETDRRHLARATEIDADTCDLLHPLGPPRGSGPPVMENSGDELAVLRDAFACRGIEAVLADLGRAEFDIPVVQAVAPGLQLMPSEMPTERLNRLIATTGGGQRLTRGIPLH